MEHDSALPWPLRFEPRRWTDSYGFDIPYTHRPTPPPIDDRTRLQRNLNISEGQVLSQSRRTALLGGTTVVLAAVVTTVGFFWGFNGSGSGQYSSGFVTCRSPAASSNLVVISNSPQYAVGQNVTYQCADGYTPENAFSDQLTCGLTGQFNFTSTTCREATCAAPVVSAEIILDKNKAFYFTEEEETLRCGEGYAGNPANITCNADGQFSGVTAGKPDCLRKCALFSSHLSYTIKDANEVIQEFTKDSFILKGSQYKLECPIGSVGEETIITCDTEGHIQGPTPTCDTICFIPQYSDYVLQHVENGSEVNFLNNAMLLPTGQQYKLSCPVGYEGDSTTIMCNITGQFKAEFVGPQPRCYEMCPAPVYPEYEMRDSNGTVQSYSSQQYVSRGSRFTLNCMDGYQGTSIIRCNHFTSQIEGNEPTCLKMCDSPNQKYPQYDIANIYSRNTIETFTNQPYVHQGEKYVLWCPYGYHDRETIVTCNTTGQFEGEEPVCLKQCTPPVSTADIVRFGVIKSFTAEDRFNQGHDFTLICPSHQGGLKKRIICNGSAQWEGDHPVCLTRCSAPSGFPSLLIVRNVGSTIQDVQGTQLYDQETILRIECPRPEYEFNRTEIQCNSSAEWELQGEIPICTPRCSVPVSSGYQIHNKINVPVTFNGDELFNQGDYFKLRCPNAVGGSFIVITCNSTLHWDPDSSLSTCT